MAASLFLIAVWGAPGMAQESEPGGIAPPPSGEVPLPTPFGAAPIQDPNDPLAVPDSVPEGSFETVEPVIGTSLDDLPPPVRRMREMIMEAARTGDFDALRPLIGSGSNTTQLSLGGFEGDPVEFLKGLGGDPDGYEILAIMLEVLEANYAVYDPGTANEIYVWPYFVATSLEDLKPEQLVDLFKLVTSGDYEDMRAFGAYIFYRVGITPDGRWRFFVAGD